MTRTEWEAMDDYDKYDLVWSLFPEIEPASDDWVLSTDAGKSGFDFFDTEAEANNALVRYQGKAIADGATVVHWRHAPHFTTDRNACALVLDAIADRDEERDEAGLVNGFEIALFKQSGACFGGWSDFDTIRLSSDLICYCAVKAVEQIDSTPLDSRNEL